MPKEISKWPGPRPKHFRGNCLGKGWRADGEKGPHPLQGSLAVLRRRVKPWWEERSHPFLGIDPPPRLVRDPEGDDGVPFSPSALPTISEIYFGVCSSMK